MHGITSILSFAIILNQMYPFQGITIIVRAEAVITGNNGVSIALSWYAIVRNTRIELQFYCIAYCIAMYQVTNSNYLVLHSGHPPFILSAGLRPECMKCIALFLVMIQENLRVPFMRISLYLQSIHLTIKQRVRLCYEIIMLCLLNKVTTITKRQ